MASWCLLVSFGAFFSLVHPVPCNYRYFLTLPALRQQQGRKKKLIVPRADYNSAGNLSKMQREIVFAVDPPLTTHHTQKKTPDMLHLCLTWT